MSIKNQTSAPISTPAQADTDVKIGVVRSNVENLWNKTSQLMKYFEDIKLISSINDTLKKLIKYAIDITTNTFASMTDATVPKYDNTNGKYVDSCLVEDVDSLNSSKPIEVTGVISATTAKLSNLTDGYVPVHTSDVVGLANSPLYYDAANNWIAFNRTVPNATLDILGQTPFMYTLKLVAAANGGGVELLKNEDNAGYAIRIENSSYVIPMAVGWDGNTSFGTQNATERVTVEGNIKASGDIYSVAFVDYKASANVQGWVSAAGYVKYKKIGKLVYCEFYLDGVSNSTTTAFSLPFSPVNGDNWRGYHANVDNVGGIPTINLSTVFYDGYFVFEKTVLAGNGSWTASNVKRIWGQFFFETA